jgi:hypothetical protein
MSKRTVWLSSLATASLLSFAFLAAADDRSTPVAWDTSDAVDAATSPGAGHPAIDAAYAALNKDEESIHVRPQGTVMTAPARQGSPDQPAALVTPTAFNFWAVSDSATSAQLTINNAGDEDLEWSLLWESDIVTFDDIDFSPNQDPKGGSVQWHTGDTCDCDVEPYNFNLYAQEGVLGFYWPFFEEDNEAGVSFDGSSYAVLLEGEVIGPGSDFINTSVVTAADNWRSSDGIEGYLGFRFINPDNLEVNYGYARITTTGTDGFPATIHGWAYNQVGDPIEAGERPALSACQRPDEIPWLDTSLESGTTSPGEFSTVDIMVDTEDLSVGSYEALLCLTTNDPDQDVIEIPVGLTVAEDVIFFDRFEGATE